jgi:hypothetical protein
MHPCAFPCSASFLPVFAHRPAHPPLGPQADDALVRDLERRTASLGRQTDLAAEGLRALSASTHKRADEHASAIQRLTLVRSPRGEAGAGGRGCPALASGTAVPSRAAPRRP